MDVISGQYGCDSILYSIDLELFHVEDSAYQSGGDLIVDAMDATFQWVNCEIGMTPIDGATDSIFDWLVDGSYAIIVTLSGCVDTSESIHITAVALENNELEPVIVVSPNPGNGEFLFELGKEAQSIILTVYDVQGKILVQQKHEETNRFQTELIGALGVYIADIHLDEFKPIRVRLLLQ